MQKRASQSGGLFDSIFKSDFTIWKVKDGDNNIRFLPPTWEHPEHFGMDVFVHYGIGSDNQAYLCLDKMKGETCPVCEEKKQADKAGDSDYARELSANKRVLVWLIDRDNEETGPQLWAMPWTVDRDIATLCIDKRTREILFIDSPDEGYDVTFTKTGAKMKTKYIGVKVARRPSPLSDDDDVVGEWMDYITENSLPDTLQYFDAEHIADVAAGKKTDKDDDDDDDDAPKTRASKKSRKSSRDDADEEEDEEEDESPRRSKVKGKQKAHSRDEEEEDEEDAPPKKSTGKSWRHPKDTDEDDEEEEAPRKSKVKAKSRPVDDEEDEEDEPLHKNMKPRKGKYSEDEDDEEGKKKGARRPTLGKATSHSKSRDDEDSDDDEDEFDCVACSDTGKNSKGGYCVCIKGKKLKAKAAAKAAEEEDDEEDDE